MTFNNQKITDNFYSWVKSLGDLTGVATHAHNNLCWINTKLNFSCLNYICNRYDNVEGLKEAIDSFTTSKTPFFFCNGEMKPNKASTKIIQELSNSASIVLDGMVFNLDKPLPKVKTAIDIELVEVKTKQQIKDWVNTSPLGNGHDLDSSKDFFKNLTNSSITYLLAYHMDKPIGCSMLFHGSTGVAGNYWGAVLPEYRCNGICSLMTLKRLEKAKALGYTHLTAQCMDTSTRLYQRLGFDRVCELEFYLS